MVSLRRTRAADLPYVTVVERLPVNRDLIGQWTDDEHRAAIGGQEGWEHWINERFEPSEEIGAGGEMPGKGAFSMRSRAAS